MKAIYTYVDRDLGPVHIVIPKIREVGQVMGSVVIVFDNGDKENLNVSNPEQVVREILDGLRLYYQ